MIEMNARTKVLYDYLVFTHVAPVNRESFQKELEEFLEEFLKAYDADKNTDDDDDEPALPEVGDRFFDETGNIIKVLATCHIDENTPLVVTMTTRKHGEITSNTVVVMSLGEFENTVVRQVN